MSFAKKRNKGSKFNINTQGFDFKKLSELKDDQVYQVCGVKVFTTKYGDSPAAILKDCYVNLPKHMADDVYEILVDDDDVDAINAGKVGLKKRSYHSDKYDKDCIGIEWVDIE